MSEELLPCPFCGTTEKLKVQKFLGRTPQDYDSFRVLCENITCFVQGPRVGVTSHNGDEFYKAEAIAQWNTRTPCDPTADDRG